MFHFFDSDVFIPLMVFAIPIVAIVGGITAGIVRSIGNQRLVELAHRERIAALERGVDPSKLPPLPTMEESRDMGDAGWSGASRGLYNSHHSDRRRSQGLMIGGIVTLFTGIGLMLFFHVLNEGTEHVWAVGMIPAAVGLALLLSAMIVRPRDGGMPPSPPAPPAPPSV
jgi:hypothetical protein